MLFSWPLAFFVVNTKVNKKSFARSFSISFGILILSLWLIFILSDLIVPMTYEKPWLYYAYPIGWILLGVLFALANITLEKNKE